MQLNDNTGHRTNDSDIPGQVLNTFLKIDRKILDLHKCSSDDFLTLNKSLKNNHQSFLQITEKVNEAFNRLGPEGNLKKIELIKNSFYDLHEDIIAFEADIRSSLAMLERIQNNFSLMFIPINNFRQNLTSLKLLLSNNKLTHNGRGLNNFSENEASQYDAVITKVKENCPVFEENIYVIQNHLKTLHSEFQNLKNLLDSDIVNSLEQLKHDFEILEKHNLESIRLQGNFNSISHNYHHHVETIVTHLQYHDIIRQKMEHIQQTQKLVIEEINETASVEERARQKEVPHLMQIPQIAEIQSAQLLHANKEYQAAIDQISKKMIDMGQELMALSKIFKDVGQFEHKGRKVSLDITSQVFKKLTTDKRSCIKKFKLLNEDVSLIQQIVHNLSDKFNDLEMIENSIEQSIIKKISFNNLLVSEEQETASQAQQILKLYADNHLEKRKIRTLFINTNAFLKEFTKASTVCSKEQNGMDKINLDIDLADKTFDEIFQNIEFMENTYEEIKHKSNEIEFASHEVVSQVKYYDFFEKTIDELIQDFDQINNLIKQQENYHHHNAGRKKSLKQIENYYTMKSERIIHNKSLLKDGNKDIRSMVEKLSLHETERAGNDVEFF
jgi:hypothetical protein